MLNDVQKYQKNEDDDEEDENDASFMMPDDEEEEEEEFRAEEEDSLPSLMRELHRLREVEIKLVTENQRLNAHIAAQRQLCDTLQESLLETASTFAPRHGDERLESPISSAVRSGDLALVDALIPSSSSRAIGVHATLSAALQAACQHRRRDVVEHIVDRCSKDVVRADHDSALLWACLNGDGTIAKMLIDRGADPNAISGCPLRLAVRGGFADVAKILVESGARPA